MGAFGWGSVLFGGLSEGCEVGSSLCWSALVLRFLFLFGLGEVLRGGSVFLGSAVTLGYGVSSAPFSWSGEYLLDVWTGAAVGDVYMLDLAGVDADFAGWL